MSNYSRRNRRNHKNNRVNFAIVLIAVIFIIVSALLFSGCGNMTMIDTTYHFDRAIIALPGGEIVEGKVETWTDFEDGDQIQVKIDGKTYLVHSTNVALIAD